MHFGCVVSRETGESYAALAERKVEEVCELEDRFDPEMVRHEVDALVKANKKVQEQCPLLSESSDGKLIISNSFTSSMGILASIS